ncbi:MAG: prepilin-type N-terminal cleavage/methylation domain-containing protein [Candidatus Omnitrophica bacterium]|nr:prepilin-type N-terminal cleavage/methylation domain-containing protein [Candidatus Omnitrophota bacterium]
MKRTGFTLIELVIVMALLMILTGALIFVFLACFRSWNASAGRARTRTDLAQSLELIGNDLRSATSIDATTATSVQYWINYNGTAVHLRLYRYSPSAGLYWLLKGTVGDPDSRGAVLVTGVQAGGADIFTQTGSLYTIDLTINNDGQVVHMRTKARARNP